MTSSVSSTSDKKYTMASFFAGVGGIELGFEQTGEFRVVYANEFDKNAQKTYKANFPDVHLDERDIHDIDDKELPDNIDVITGGFPCQAFSIAGYQKGFEDERGDLFFELLRMITHKQPRAIFIENVKNMVSHDHGNTFKVIREALVTNGYYLKWKVLNTKDYGNVPQNRERIYIVGFKSETAYQAFAFPESIPLTTSPKDVIDFIGQKDETYYYQEGKQPFYETLEEGMTDPDAIYQWRRQYVRKNKSGVVPTLTANMGTGGHNVPIILSDTGIRKLTPRETFNVQGFPEDFILPNDTARGQLYKQAGNSVSIPVVNRIAEKIAEALKFEDEADTKKTTPEAQYSIVYTDLWSRYMGKSELIDTVDSIDDIKSFERKKNNMIHFIDDEIYTKIIKKGMRADFYSVVNLIPEEANRKVHTNE
ncbi:DNA cytosine methyltransferase [Aerococcaceae bacterium DSM 111020]|nr:DNA cytosine methyltransferase [Aerococcaceae bacterium DSM 111020]